MKPAETSSLELFYTLKAAAFLFIFEFIFDVVADFVKRNTMKFLCNPIWETKLITT